MIGTKFTTTRSKVHSLLGFIYNIYTNRLTVNVVAQYKINKTDPQASSFTSQYLQKENRQTRSRKVPVPGVFDRNFNNFVLHSFKNPGFGSTNKKCGSETQPF